MSMAGAEVNSTYAGFDPGYVISDDGSIIISHDNPEQVLWEPWILHKHFIPVVTTNVITFILGFLGNTLVIITMCADRPSRNVTAMFLVSLAVADLLLILIVIPYQTTKYFIINWTVGEAMCKISAYCEKLAAAASVLNLTALSVERYLVITYPMRARSWCTMSNSRKILSLSWLLAILIALPMIFIKTVQGQIYGSLDNQVTVYHCADDGTVEDAKALVLYWFFILFIVPAVVMVAAYTRVIWVLWLSARTMGDMTGIRRSQNQNGTALMSASSYDQAPANSTKQKQNEMAGISQASESVAIASTNKSCEPTSSNAATLLNHDSNKPSSGGMTKSRQQETDPIAARKQVIRMLIAVVLIFIACWGPKFCYAVYLRFKKTKDFGSEHYYLKIFVNHLPYIHSCINPIIYGFMSANFRRATLRIISRLCCWCNGHVFRGRCRCMNYEQYIEMATKTQGTRTYMSQTNAKNKTDMESVVL